MILGDIHDAGGQFDWLHYDWLEPLTETPEQVEQLNNKYKHLNWKFKTGGRKHYAGAQATGKQMRELITK